jgi:hypothetical protein
VGPAAVHCIATNDLTNEIILVVILKEVMGIHIEDISLLSSFLFIKCCLYILKIIVTHDMDKCLF